ncbi:MAG: hypothetical protein WCY77_12060 [Weeksellaceae bacterium]
MKNSFKIFSLLLLLSSCVSDGNKAEKLDKKNNEQVEEEKIKNIIEPVEEKEPKNIIHLHRTASDDVENKMSQKIQYSDLTIALEKIDMGWFGMSPTGNDSLYITDKDTAYFHLWSGEWFYDKKFKIEEPGFDKIELYEKILFNMAMNSNQDIEDVPLCVIYNWKTFESEWSQIQLDADNLKFQSNEEEINPVINFTVEEFKKAVKEHCGIEWYNEIKDIKSKEQLPSELFTTTYIFKIAARNSETGERIEKFIVFEAPTSS